jgi:hypothetical protein
VQRTVIERLPQMRARTPSDPRFNRQHMTCDPRGVTS